MGLIVQKYGGSSVATHELIKRSAQRIIDKKRGGDDVVVVVSAMGNTTDQLFDLTKKISENPPGRELDMLLSSGERISMALLSMAINSLGHQAVSFTGSQSGIITDNTHTKARIRELRPKRIAEEIKNGKIVIVAGFQGVSDQHEITTLGRGGSDMTAVALSHALGAKECEILTDVDGVFTADPKVVPNARKLESISYEEMLELASSGAEVLFHRSVGFAKRYGVVLHVRSSFNDKAGTIIKEEDKSMEEILVHGVAHNTKEAKITITGIQDKPGNAATIFGQLAQAGVNVDMILQNVSLHGLADISFTVPESEASTALQCCRDLKEKMGFKDISFDKKIAKVSIVGAGMRTHFGVAAKMFEALARKGINIEMVSTSEIKISCVIRKNRTEEAVRALHDAFGLEKVR